MDEPLRVRLGAASRVNGEAWLEAIDFEGKILFGRASLAVAGGGEQPEACVLGHPLLSWEEGVTG
jgi:hypothetical protein